MFIKFHVIILFRISCNLTLIILLIDNEQSPLTLIDTSIKYFLPTSNSLELFGRGEQVGGLKVYIRSLKVHIAGIWRKCSAAKRAQS